MAVTDMALLEEIYAFCLPRAKERAAEAHGRLDGIGLRHAEATIEMLDHLRGDAHADPTRADEVMDLLRLYALKDRAHPEYKPEWHILR